METETLDTETLAMLDALTEGIELEIMTEEEVQTCTR